jgi:hypothetical protein
VLIHGQPPTSKTDDLIGLQVEILRERHRQAKWLVLEDFASH